MNDSTAAHTDLLKRPLTGFSLPEMRLLQQLLELEKYDYTPDESFVLPKAEKTIFNASEDLPEIDASWYRPLLDSLTTHAREELEAARPDLIVGSLEDVDLPAEGVRQSEFLHEFKATREEEQRVTGLGKGLCGGGADARTGACYEIMCHSPFPARPWLAVLHCSGSGYWHADFEGPRCCWKVAVPGAHLIGMAGSDNWMTQTVDRMPQNQTIIIVL